MIGVPHWDRIFPGPNDNQRADCRHKPSKRNNRAVTIDWGQGVWYCYYCDAGGRVGGVEPPRNLRLPERVEDRQGAVDQILEHSFPAPSTDVEAYLNYRGIDLDHFPQDVFFHKALTYFDDGHSAGRHPAMVCLIRDVDGHVAGLHRTYLAPLGMGKATVPSPKKYLRGAVASLSGTAIRLYPAAKVLAVAEGIESALAVRAMTGLPVWSSRDKGGMRSLILPTCVHEVRIYADAEPSAVEAARELGERAIKAGRKAVVIWSTTSGNDPLDDLIGAHNDV